MPSNDWIYEFAALCLESGECAFLVCSHELAVADYISRENGGQAALDTFLGHMLPLRSETTVQKIVITPPREVYSDEVPQGVKLSKSSSSE
jgi:hypothetical protein